MSLGLSDSKNSGDYENINYETDYEDNDENQEDENQEDENEEDENEEDENQEDENQEDENQEDENEEDENEEHQGENQEGENIFFVLYKVSRGGENYYYVIVTNTGSELIEEYKSLVNQERRSLPYKFKSIIFNNMVLQTSDFFSYFRKVEDNDILSSLVDIYNIDEKLNKYIEDNDHVKNEWECMQTFAYDLNGENWTTICLDEISTVELNISNINESDEEYDNVDETKFDIDVNFPNGRIKLPPEYINVDENDTTTTEDEDEIYTPYSPKDETSSPSSTSS